MAIKKITKPCTIIKHYKNYMQVYSCVIFLGCRRNSDVGFTFFRRRGTGIQRHLISRLLKRHEPSLKPAEIKIKAFVLHPRVSSVGKSVRLYLWRSQYSLCAFVIVQRFDSSLTSRGSVLSCAPAGRGMLQPYSSLWLNPLSPLSSRGWGKC